VLHQDRNQLTPSQVANLPEFCLFRSRDLQACDSKRAEATIRARNRVPRALATGRLLYLVRNDAEQDHDPGQQIGDHSQLLAHMPCVDLYVIGAETLLPICEQRYSSYYRKSDDCEEISHDHILCGAGIRNGGALASAYSDNPGGFGRIWGV